VSDPGKIETVGNPQTPLEELERADDHGSSNGGVLQAPGRRFEPSRARGREPIEIDGKFFATGGDRFDFRGVTYGTFAPRSDGALFPERDRLERDLATMRAAGFTVVRTYTLPTDDLLEAAAGNGLRVLAGLF